MTGTNNLAVIFEKTKKIPKKKTNLATLSLLGAFPDRIKGFDFYFGFLWGHKNCINVQGSHLLSVAWPKFTKIKLIIIPFKSSFVRKSVLPCLFRQKNEVIGSV